MHLDDTLLLLAVMLALVAAGCIYRRAFESYDPGHDRQARLVALYTSLYVAASLLAVISAIAALVFR